MIRIDHAQRLGRRVRRTAIVGHRQRDGCRSRRRRSRARASSRWSHRRHRSPRRSWRSCRRDRWTRTRRGCRTDPRSSAVMSAVGGCVRQRRPSRQRLGVDRPVIVDDGQCGGDGASGVHVGDGLPCAERRTVAEVQRTRRVPSESGAVEASNSSRLSAHGSLPQRQERRSVALPRRRRRTCRDRPSSVHHARAADDRARADDGRAGVGRRRQVAEVSGAALRVPLPRVEVAVAGVKALEWAVYR